MTVAVAVLLCHVLCACGGSKAIAATAVASVQDPAGAAASHPGCHGHGDDGDGNGVSSKQKDDRPAPCHEDPSSCEHCKRPAVAASENGSSLGDLRPTALLAEPFAPSWSTGPVLIPATHVRLVACDLPPPQGGSTLLSLHCALNT